MFYLEVQNCFLRPWTHWVICFAFSYLSWQKNKIKIKLNTASVYFFPSLSYVSFPVLYIII